MSASPTHWSFHFLASPSSDDSKVKRALIILNQDVSAKLLEKAWTACTWWCCADGGANRLYDSLGSQPAWRTLYVPDLIKGDLDSIRPDVQRYYASQGVRIVQDDDQDSTDLMKCFAALEEKEEMEGHGQYEVVLLGGLAGRLDQTVHTVSLLHKLRKSRTRIYAVTDDNMGCVLDQGEHLLDIDHSVFGKTCGLLPVGVDATVLSTRGLKWNLNEQESGFEGLISTSNHLLPEERIVWIRTTRPIWWTMELDITRVDMIR